MKFVGRADGTHTIICRLFDDATVADVAEFYADLPASTAVAAGPARAPRDAPRSPKCRRFARPPGCCASD